MANLSTRTKHIVGFIRTTYALTPAKLSTFVDWLKDNATTFGAILHDKDTSECGELIVPHIHFVADMNTARRLSSFLKDISDVLNVNPLAVSINKYVSFEMSFQYLIHKNDSDKFQYPIDELRCSLTKDECDLYMSYHGEDAFDFDMLYEIVATSPDILSIIQKVGLKTYRIYRHVILDIWSCVVGKKQLHMEVKGAE